jgi:phage gpG-like protein
MKLRADKDNINLYIMSRDFKNMSKDFKRMTNEIKDFIVDDFPYIVATESEKHFKASFDNQGFTDKFLTKWKIRDVDSNPSKYSAKERQKSKGRAILIGHHSGDRLRDSIYTRTSATQVDIIAPKPYAEVHNKGGRAGRNLAALIPKRQYIGKSQELDSAIEIKTDKEISKIINKYG